jgi:hypothetical protein
MAQAGLTQTSAVVVVLPLAPQPPFGWLTTRYSRGWRQTGQLLPLVPTAISLLPKAIITSLLKERFAINKKISSFKHKNNLC